MYYARPQTRCYKVTFGLVANVLYWWLLASQQQHQTLYNEISWALSALDILSGNVAEHSYFLPVVGLWLVVSLRKTLLTKHAYNVRNVFESSIWPVICVSVGNTLIYHSKTVSIRVYQIEPDPCISWEKDYSTMSWSDIKW